jgi:hypothetical protein
MSNACCMITVLQTLAAWVLHNYQSLLKSPKKVRIIELGPGKGTLMKHMLTALRMMARGGELLAAAELHMVEICPALRQQQSQAMDCIDTLRRSEVWRALPRLVLSDNHFHTQGRCVINAGCVDWLLTMLAGVFSPWQKLPESVYAGRSRFMFQCGANVSIALCDTPQPFHSEPMPHDLQMPVNVVATGDVSAKPALIPTIAMRTVVDLSDAPRPSPKPPVAAVNISDEVLRLGGGVGQGKGALHGLLSAADPLERGHCRLTGGAISWHGSLNDVRSRCTRHELAPTHNSCQGCLLGLRANKVAG